MDAELLAIIVKICQGITKAEGWGVPHTIPTEANNPGDLCLGDRFGLGMLGFAKITVFPKADPAADIEDKEDGYSSLKREVRAILLGKSHVYQADWTIEEIAQKWTATDPDNWSRIVAGHLGVPASTPLNKITA